MKRKLSFFKSKSRKKFCKSCLDDQREIKMLKPYPFIVTLARIHHFTVGVLNMSGKWSIVCKNREKNLIIFVWQTVFHSVVWGRTKIMTDFIFLFSNHDNWWLKYDIWINGWNKNTRNKIKMEGRHWKYNKRVHVFWYTFPYLYTMPVNSAPVFCSYCLSFLTLRQGKLGCTVF